MGPPKSMRKKPAELEKLATREIRHFLYMTNCKVAEAIGSCLDEIGSSNPYAQFVGQVDGDALAAHITQQGVHVTMGVKIFAAKLLRSEVFVRVWKEKCGFERLESLLYGFSADSFCSGKGEHELIDFYSMVMEVKKMCNGREEIAKYIDRDLKTITLYLAPDLMLAP
jgi:hypothetical protein